MLGLEECALGPAVALAAGLEKIHFGFDLKHEFLLVGNGFELQSLAYWLSVPLLRLARLPGLPETARLPGGFSSGFSR